jgi:hypothetical protein
MTRCDHHQIDNRYFHPKTFSRYEWFSFTTLNLTLVKVHIVNPYQDVLRTLIPLACVVGVLGAWCHQIQYMSFCYVYWLYIIPHSHLSKDKARVSIKLKYVSLYHIKICTIYVCTKPNLDVFHHNNLGVICFVIENLRISALFTILPFVIPTPSSIKQ